MNNIRKRETINKTIGIKLTRIVDITECDGDEPLYMLSTEKKDLMLYEHELNSQDAFQKKLAAEFGHFMPCMQEPDWQKINQMIKDLAHVKESAEVDPDESFKDFKTTDAGNAEVYAKQIINKVVYIPERRKFYIFNGKLWQPDDTGKVIHGFKLLLRNLQQLSFQASDVDKRGILLKHLIRSESHPRIKAATELVKSEPGISMSIHQFDCDPYLLNVENGTIDLKTGDILTHKASDFISKLCPVEYNQKAKAPLFEKFLADVTDRSKELENYLQTVVGYWLTGNTSEQSIFIVFGDGCNGKSTFIEIIRELFSNYAVNIPVETLLFKAGNAANELVRLKGARLATTGEPERGSKLAEGIVKLLTGGDTITGRGLYRDSEEFQNEAKIVMVTNHLPKILGSDDAIWRRIKVIPFTVKIPESKRDKNILDKLQDELPGILNWALEGCRMWLKDGLKAPEIVNQYTNKYKAEQDVFADFLQEYTITKPGAKVKGADLFTVYQVWCRDDGETEMSRRDFTHSMEERGFPQRKKTGGHRYFMGLELKNQF